MHYFLAPWCWWYAYYQLENNDMPKKTVKYTNTREKFLKIIT